MSADEQGYNVLFQLLNDRILLGYSAYRVEDGKIIRETDRITSGELVIEIDCSGTKGNKLEDMR
jgi:hypothetical protein